MNICVTTKDEADTLALGVRIGGLLQGGAVVELISDVGGGKTTLARGIARGLGFDQIVSSPTFTVSNVYKAPKNDIHHYDFYRLGELGVMSEELQEVLADTANIVVIEWGGQAESLLPKDRLIQVEIARVADNEQERIFTIRLPAAYQNMADKLKAEPC